MAGSLRVCPQRDRPIRSDSKSWYGTDESDGYLEGKVRRSTMPNAQKQAKTKRITLECERLRSQSCRSPHAVLANHGGRARAVGLGDPTPRGGQPSDVPTVPQPQARLIPAQADAG